MWTDLSQSPPCLSQECPSSSCWETSCEQCRGYCPSSWHSWVGVLFSVPRPEQCCPWTPPRVHSGPTMCSYYWCSSTEIATFSEQANWNRWRHPIENSRELNLSWLSFSGFSRFLGCRLPSLGLSLEENQYLCKLGWGCLGHWLRLY